MPSAREQPMRDSEAATYTIARLASEADLDAVLEIEAESFTNPWTREMYRWELQNPAVCHVYLARTPAGAAVGFCSFWLVFDEIHVNNVAVRPAYRRLGVGGTLMRHVLEAAHGLGARRATLEVRASNADALRFYQRLGFGVAGTRRHYYTNPVEDALILWWPEGSGPDPSPGDTARDPTVAGS